MDTSVWIESERIAGTGIGFIDAHLLRSLVEHGGATLWTHDGSLRSLATRLGAAFPDNR